MVDDALPALLTPPEAAQILRVSARTVYRLIEDGELTATRVGSQFRISRADLAEYLERSRRAGEPAAN